MLLEQNDYTWLKINPIKFENVFYQSFFTHQFYIKLGYNSNLMCCEIFT